MPPDRTRLLPLFERLIDEPDPRRRERWILRAAEPLTGATAGALLREVDGHWRTRVSRGPLALLPHEHQVDAVASGTLPQRLPEGRAVLIAGRCALALGGIAPALDDGRDTEDALDLLEAILVTHELLDDADSTAQDHVLSPFPGAPELRARSGVHGVHPRPLAGELRELLRHIRRAQEGFSRERANAPEEWCVWTEALDRVCERAGDLWIDACTDGDPSEISLACLFAHELRTLLPHVDLADDVRGRAARLHLRGERAELAERIRGLVDRARAEDAATVVLRWRVESRGCDGLRVEAEGVRKHESWLPLRPPDVPDREAT